MNVPKITKPAYEAYAIPIGKNFITLEIKKTAITMEIALSEVGMNFSYPFDIFAKLLESIPKKTAAAK